MLNKTKGLSLTAAIITLSMLGTMLVPAYAKYTKEVSAPEPFPVVVKNSTIQYVNEVEEGETTQAEKGPSATTEPVNPADSHLADTTAEN